MEAGPSHFHLLASAGALRAGYSTHDWSHSPVGHPQGWSASLRAAVALILESEFPMFIAWGTQLAFLYNAAYLAVAGDMHRPALLPKVFELFSQAERTPDRAQGGLGLGLALVRSLVELHGGSVAASSEGRGTGSEFTVRLPRLSTHEPVQPAAATARPRHDRAPLRVLLVDDNIDAGQTLAMLLETAGHVVTTSHDPRDALLRASQTRFDACLLDIGLPGMDGFELARRLRAMETERPALMVAITGYGQQFDRDSALTAGFDQYFVKPADPEELFALLAKARPRG
jgi:CheY-like chemotaxis protein